MSAGPRGPAAPSVVQLPLRRFQGIDSNEILRELHSRQQQYPIRQLWDRSLQLPVKHLEYLSSACRELSPCVRQETVLMLKRYVKELLTSGQAPHGGSLQVVILTCANLAAKYWQNHGLPEQKLHKLSCNAFTRNEFIDAEVQVLSLLGCNVHWSGVLLIEWVSLLLFLCRDLLAEGSDVDTLMDVAVRLMDALAFQDHLMAQHLPAELAAAVLHASVQLCTKSFREYHFCRRVNHLCRVEDGDVSALSERILQVTVGQQCAELVIEGASMSDEDLVEHPIALADRDEL